MDPPAPGRNEEERPALIYRNDTEVAKATATALRAAVVSTIAENTSVSNFRQLRFSPKAKYHTLESLQPLAEENGAGLSKLNPSQRRDLLEDHSARTEVEKADGAQSFDDGEPRAMKKDTDSDSDRDSEYVGNCRRGRMTFGPRRLAASKAKRLSEGNMVERINRPTRSGVNHSPQPGSNRIRRRSARQ